MHSAAISHFHILTTIFLTLLIPHLTIAQINTTLNSGDLSKRGLLYIGTDHSSDNAIFTSSSSPLTWYYNYASSPSIRTSHFTYVPMIHSLDNFDGDISAIRSLDDVEYILIFNEPDGTTDSGGSNITPRAAARTFINDIMPMRESHGWKISLPATTGSGSGLNWLSLFNESCYALSPNGCAFDFVAAHWYGEALTKAGLVQQEFHVVTGKAEPSMVSCENASQPPVTTQDFCCPGDFPGMASWLGTLHALYPEKEIWLTEFALPQADELATVAMMNESLPFLDELDWIARYAWFGAFRKDDANEWTGDGVSLFDVDGGLTQAGAVYLGGVGRGFEIGESEGEQNIGRKRNFDRRPLLGVMFVVVTSWLGS